MTNIAGFDIPWEISIQGWLSNSWIWVAIVCILGFILIGAVVILIFFLTYKRKIVIWDERGGMLEPIMKTRARIVKLRTGGGEIMKTLFGGYWLSAYGQRVGRNTYYYRKGKDGYLYNFILDKYGTPVYVSGDMRMFHIAIDRMSEKTYGGQGFLEKYAVHMMLFAFLIIFLLGMWLIVGKLAEAIKPLEDSNEKSLKLTEAQDKLAIKLDAILRSIGKLPEQVENESSTGGLIPAT